MRCRCWASRGRNSWMNASPGSRGRGAGGLGRRKPNLKFCFLLKQDLLFCPCFLSRVCRKGYIKCCHLQEVQAAGHGYITFCLLRVRHYTAVSEPNNRKTWNSRYSFCFPFILEWESLFLISLWLLGSSELTQMVISHCSLQIIKFFFLSGCDGACL